MLIHTQQVCSDCECAAHDRLRLQVLCRCMAVLHKRHHAGHICPHPITCPVVANCLVRLQKIKQSANEAKGESCAGDLRALGRLASCMHTSTSTGSQPTQKHIITTALAVSVVRCLPAQVIRTSLTTAFSHSENGTQLACITPGCRYVRHLRDTTVPQ